MISRSALIWLSRQEGLKDFATRFGFFKKLTTRFVAGETIDEVIPYIRQINAENCTRFVRSFERSRRIRE
jgi:proline dehydrogenase